MHLQMQIEIEVFSPSCILLHFYCVVIGITYKYNRLGCVFLAVSAVIRNGFACCFFFSPSPLGIEISKNVVGYSNLFLSLV